MATFDWILLGANRGAGFLLHLDALSYHPQDLGQRRKVYPLTSTDDSSCRTRSCVPFFSHAFGKGRLAESVPDLVYTRL